MKNIVKIFSSIVGIGLISLIWFFCVKFDGCGKKGKIKAARKAAFENTNQIKQIQKQLLDTTSIYLVGNTIHSSSNVIAGTKSQLDIFLKRKIDSLRNLIGVKDNQIQSLNSELVVAKGDIKSQVIPINGGNGVYEIPFDDGCFLKGYSFVDLESMTQDMHYETKLNLHEVTYYRYNHQLFRNIKWINKLTSWCRWGGVSLKVDTWTDCPNVKIDSIQDIQIIKTN